MFLGGRGLDMYLLYNHIKPGIDPLGPDNVLLVSAGLLVGTLAAASGRTNIAGKSPLTGYLGRSNMGGFFAPEMRWAGFDHLIIKGRAEKPVYLWIQNGEIEIRDASHLWGKPVREGEGIIRDELEDKNIKVLGIGEAGEKLVRFANVMTGIKNSGGRTGMGCLFGSKNLKAIAVRGTMDIKIAHPEDALKYNERVIKDITKSKVSQVMGKLGTPFIWGATNSQGLVRCRNFQLNQLENSSDIEPETYEKFITGWASCFGCAVHCRSKYVITEGPYKGTYDEGPEYTSTCTWAGETDCRSALTIHVCNHLVNLYGLDTLDTGNIIAWAMELYEKGILTDKDTDGLKLKFGNDKALIEMIHRIGKREGLGNILAKGPLRAAKKIGKDSMKYLLQIKGMGQLNSDERATPALALNIATASRGADHLSSRPAIDLYHLPEPVLRKIYGQPVAYDGPLTSDYRDYEGKAWMVRWQELLYEAVDSLGICKFQTVFLGPNLPNWDEWSQLIYLNCGLELSPLDIWNAADRSTNMERLFNLREGLTRKDDWLPDQYFDQPTTLGIPGIRGLTINREKFTRMIDEYYEYHGWDKNGVPRPETLQKLAINKEPSHKL
ncbi:MAG: aldehyde ferredoxin oxidoreductase family protein [Proteobacteria bacterium]|nr:aldehyde ferredoxin oxidoreductase family protein [Pseudomonadota bacterium]